jgi:peptide/nickel transport system ATP-binding protein
MEVLHVSDLSFGYTKEKLLYKDFNLSLHVGQIKAIVGESGVGKSTLFELILKNLKPIKGTLTCKRVSQVFQDPYSSFHPSYKIIEQIKDVAGVSEIEKYLESINLDGMYLEKYSHELSGGELQRASILRALLMKPQLLLLDEPTSALDNIIQLDVMKMLLTQLDSMGMLLITHDKDLASWCSDEVIEITKGSD